jgi:hypothetical protein
MMIGKTKQCDSIPNGQRHKTIGAIIRLNGITIKRGQDTKYLPIAREARYSSY